MRKTTSTDLLTARNDDEADAIKRRQQEAQRQFDANRRAEQEAQRNMFTHFRMWTVCPDKRCMRAHACNGDVEICLRERWHVHIPDETRALLGKTFELMRDGLSPHEAVAAAQADIARRKKLAAEFDARPAPIQEAPAQPAPVRRRAPIARGPRVRGLG